MALTFWNATVTVTHAGAVTLSNVHAKIKPATTMDQDPLGGVIHYIAYLDPPTILVATGDMLTILAWPPFVVDPLRGYRITSPQYSGQGSLAVLQLKLSEWVGR